MTCAWLLYMKGIYFFRNDVGYTDSKKTPMYGSVGYIESINTAVYGSVGRSPVTRSLARK
jgi:hypothetical protein